MVVCCMDTTEVDGESLSSSIQGNGVPLLDLESLPEG